MGLWAGLRYIAAILIAFLLGWFSFDAYSYFSNINKEQPLSFSSNELKSPGDWISESDINLTKNRVIISVNSPRWARFADTNSMDPVIDDTANSIELRPGRAESLSAGDIISYKSDEGIIIHRIVEIGEDEKGWFAVTKGDNNGSVDPLKVRFEQIIGVVIAVLY